MRIESAGVVDEPVVSVDLSFNCGFFATRRYVLLTDIESADLAPKIATVGSVSYTHLDVYKRQARSTNGWWRAPTVPGRY